MISYMVATLPWTVGCIVLSPPSSRGLKWRKYTASAFFGAIAPLVYFYIQHKVHRVPGGEQIDPVLAWLTTAAYTTYAFFEWSLIILDVAFDAATLVDFEGLEILVRDVKGTTQGYVQRLPG